MTEEQIINKIFNIELAFLPRNGCCCSIILNDNVVISHDYYPIGDPDFAFIEYQAFSFAIDKLQELYGLRFSEKTILLLWGRCS